MTFKELRSNITTPFFYSGQVKKVFQNESDSHINTQLSRMANRRELLKLKRGLYLFADTKLSEYSLSNILYNPSYVSLESALNTYGIAPDIAANVTAVTPTTSKKINSQLGEYIYSKISFNLFFGYQLKKDPNYDFFYNIAEPEKALLDYIYIRGIKNIKEHRIDSANLNINKLRKYAKQFPAWVIRIIDEQYNK